METYVLSVLIPTKNRQKYAAFAIEQILQIESRQLQIIVQDNSDNDELSKIVTNKFNDPRLKYNYIKESISTIENFNLAIENSDGEYICIIGDDDGITKQIIDVVNWAKINNIDAINPALSATYFWPNSGARKEGKDTGCLSIHKMTAKAKICYPKKGVEKLLSQGCQNYLPLDLVKLYHGIVRRSCLDTLKKQTGKYFAGLSPDIFISVSLSLNIEKMIKIDFPLTISGICHKSTSADSATGRHTGKWEDAPHFSGHTNYHWSELVPKFYGVETIWADSALAALTDQKKPELTAKFNLTALTAYCLVNHPEYKNIIMTHYHLFYPSKITSFLKIVFAIIKYPLLDLIKYLVYRLGRLFNGFTRTYNIIDIIEANESVQKRIDEFGLNSKLIHELNKTVSKK